MVLHPRTAADIAENHHGHPTSAPNLCLFLPRLHQISVSTICYTLQIHFPGSRYGHNVTFQMEIYIYISPMKIDDGHETEVEGGFRALTASVSGLAFGFCFRSRVIYLIIFIITETTCKLLINTT